MEGLKNTLAFTQYQAQEEGRYNAFYSNWYFGNYLFKNIWKRVPARVFNVCMTFTTEKYILRNNVKIVDQINPMKK